MIISKRIPLTINNTFSIFLTQSRNVMKEEILEAKRKLYLLLMKLDEDAITDNEVDIMFLLSKDEQTQSIIVGICTV